MTFAHAPRPNVAARLLALALAVAVPAAARAIPRPLNPSAAGAAQPRLLSDYERSVLAREMRRLMEEVRTKREAAARDETLAPLREALAAAREEGVATNVAAAARVLSDAVEAKLYEDPAVPPKIKRLQEVGNLLEYDSRVRREQRAGLPAVVRKNETEPPPAAATNAPAAAAAP